MLSVYSVNRNQQSIILPSFEVVGDDYSPLLSSIFPIKDNLYFFVADASVDVVGLVAYGYCTHCLKMHILSRLQPLLS